MHSLREDSDGAASASAGSSLSAHLSVKSLEDVELSLRKEVPTVPPAPALTAYTAQVKLAKRQKIASLGPCCSSLILIACIGAVIGTMISSLNESVDSLSSISSQKKGEARGEREGGREEGRGGERNQRALSR